MKTLIESINTLNKNISEAAVEKETVLEGLQEFIDVINEDAETTIESITDAAEKIAEILPDKIGGGGISVNESYDISEGTLNGATITLEGDVTAHIPDGVTTIGNNAFMDNTVITKVIMPNSVLTVEDGYITWQTAGTFMGCEKLTDIVFSENLTKIASAMFSSCTGLTSITIPDSVTSIGENAFSNCKSLTSITIGDSVTNIGNYAFSNCTGLTSITIGDSVTNIGNYVFNECTSLTSITIPDSVTSIGNNVFYRCRSLTDIYYTGTQAQWEQISIGEDAIPEGATIHYNYVPE